jgi:hypothetical protein
VRSAADVVGLPPSADDGLVRAYRERTPGSAAAFEAARRVLSGGETRAVTTTPRVMINLSTALSPGDLDDIAAAYGTAFTLVRPA